MTIGLRLILGLSVKCYYLRYVIDTSRVFPKELRRIQSNFVVWPILFGFLDASKTQLLPDPLMNVIQTDLRE